jgi:hypothetical protein
VPGNLETIDGSAEEREGEGEREGTVPGNLETIDCPLIVLILLCSDSRWIIKYTFNGAT